MFSPIIAWAQLIILFVIVEAFAGNLVSACFAVGSLAAMLSTILTDSFLIEAIIFAALSLMLLFLVRPAAYRYLYAKD